MSLQKIQPWQALVVLFFFMWCSGAQASSMQPALGGGSGLTTWSKQEFFTLCLRENIFGKATLNSYISVEFSDQGGREADGNQM